MLEIALPTGQITEIDDVDADLASRRWHMIGSYAGATFSKNTRPRHELLHKVVAARVFGHIPTGMTVDHINRVKLDNRRENLRLATPAQQQFNMPNRAGASSYKGVTVDRHRGQYIAGITVDGVPRYLGRFAAETAAALAYDMAAREHIGSFAFLNFPDITDYAVVEHFRLKTPSGGHVWNSVKEASIFPNVRARCAAGETQRSVAAHFGIAQSTVGRMVRNEGRWAAPERQKICPSPGRV